MLHARQTRGVSNSRHKFIQTWVPHYSRAQYRICWVWDSGREHLASGHRSTGEQASHRMGRIQFALGSLHGRGRQRIRMDKGGRKRERWKLFCDRRRRRSHKKVPTGRNVCRGIPRSSAAGMKQIARIAAWSRGSNGTIMNCRCSNQEPLVLVIVHIGHDLGMEAFSVSPVEAFYKVTSHLFKQLLNCSAGPWLAVAEQNLGSSP